VAESTKKTGQTTLEDGEGGVTKKVVSFLRTKYGDTMSLPHTNLSDATVFKVFPQQISGLR